MRLRFNRRGASTPLWGVEACSHPSRRPNPIPAVPPYVVRTPHLHGAPTTEEQDDELESGSESGSEVEEDAATRFGAAFRPLRVCMRFLELHLGRPERGCVFGGRCTFAHSWAELHPEASAHGHELTYLTEAVVVVSGPEEEEAGRERERRRRCSSTAW